MTNQQVIEYIKIELQKGADRQTITKSLIDNGWTSLDVDEAFANLNQSVPTTPALIQNVDGSVTNRIWTKIIPRINKFFLIPYLLLVFGLDMFIGLNERSLLGFWYIMLGVFAVFMLFFLLENFVFKKRFAHSVSGLDKGIVTMVVLRNIIVLLNFIPFIQLVGLAIFLYGGWLLVLIYIIMIVRRHKQRIV